MPFGPQAGSGFLPPTPQQPMPMDPYSQWSMQNQASHEALMHAMQGGFNQQASGNLQGAGMLGARVGNTALGNPLGAALRPVGQAIKGAASSLLGSAPQSYTVGGPTTLGSASVDAAGLGASGEEAATSAVSDAAPSALGVAGQALGIAGAGYGAYAGYNSAQEALRRLHEAQSYGLDPAEEEKLRNKTFRAGAQSSVIGSAGGALGGSAYGPIGVAAGAVLGGAPGAYQAWQSADSGGERWDAQKDFMRNPFRR